MVIAFMNMKGGVGKTTLCVHLAGEAVSKGKNVLIIDYDPQFNLTQHLLKPKDYFELERVNKTIYGVLEPNIAPPSPFQIDISAEDVAPPSIDAVVHTAFRVKRGVKVNHLHIVPGSSNLMYLALGKTQSTTAPLEKRFHAFLRSAEQRYDLIFIDCHPAGSFLTKSALAMTDKVICPVVPDSYSSRGVILMKEFIEFVSKFSERSPQLRIVFNQIPWSGGDTTLEQSIRTNPEFGNLCVTQVLHASNSIAGSGRIEGQVWQRMVQWSKKSWSSRTKREITNIFQEIFSS